MKESLNAERAACKAQAASKSCDVEDYPGWPVIPAEHVMSKVAGLKNQP
jgi:hypothetical protein